jgi:hypothetical protein
MIKLAKHPKPQVLVDNEAAWTDEYLRLIAGDVSVPAAAATRYRDPAIKAALEVETSEKCGYCESKVPPVYPGACEHIAPKAMFPERVVDWDNLTYACFECNRAKGSYYDAAAPLLNPYTDDPGDHLRFVGPLCFEVPGSAQGLLTRQRLALNRMGLIERRKEKLERLQYMVATWSAMPQGSARDQYEIEIRRESGADREYTAASMAFLRDYAEWDDDAA